MKGRENVFRATKDEGTCGELSAAGVRGILELLDAGLREKEVVGWRDERDEEDMTKTVWRRRPRAQKEYEHRHERRQGLHTAKIRTNLEAN